MCGADNSGYVASDDEQAHVASDLLESLDDLYDQCITVAQLRRLLEVSSIALQGSALGPVVSAASKAIAEISERSLPEAAKNSAALVATDELRQRVGSHPPPSHA